jgi:hypothetical protein
MKMQAQDSPELRQLCELIEPMSWPRSPDEYWDAPNSKVVRMVAMAASVVAGKPIGMGDHGTLTHLTPAAGPSQAA